MTAPASPSLLEPTPRLRGASSHRPRGAGAAGWRSQGLAAVMSLSLFGTGCLSDLYRVPDDEVQRQLQLPPEQRGQNMRVVQAIGPREAPALPYGAPPPAPPGQAGYPPDGSYPPNGGYPSNAHVGVMVGVDLTPGPSYYGPGPGPRYGPGPGYAAAPTGSYAPGPGGAPAPVANRAAPTRVGGSAPNAAPAPPVRGSGTGGGGSSGGKGNSSNDAAALAVLAVVVATTAIVAAAATEGARYDGNVTVSPYQNVYLRDGSDTARATTLAALTPAEVATAKRIEISDAEGYGMLRLGRAPLNRHGFTFKLDAGGLGTRLDTEHASGVGANIGFGYFFNKYMGLLATTTLTGGDDRGGRGYLRAQIGAEAQAFLPGLGPFHFGGYGNVGAISTEIDDAGSVTGTVLGAGGLLEIELTTRLALMFRGGWSWSTLSADGRGLGWGNEGLNLSAGLAVY